MDYNKINNKRKNKFKLNPCKPLKLWKPWKNKVSFIKIIMNKHKKTHKYLIIKLH